MLHIFILINFGIALFLNLFISLINFWQGFGYVQ